MNNISVDLAAGTDGNIVPQFSGICLTISSDDDLAVSNDVIEGGNRGRQPTVCRQSFMHTHDRTGPMTSVQEKSEHGRIHYVMITSALCFVINSFFASYGNSIKRRLTSTSPKVYTIWLAAREFKIFSQLHRGIAFKFVPGHKTAAAN